MMKSICLLHRLLSQTNGTTKGAGFTVIMIGVNVKLRMRPSEMLGMPTMGRSVCR